MLFMYVKLIDLSNFDTIMQRYLIGFDRIEAYQKEWP